MVAVELSCVYSLSKKEKQYISTKYCYYWSDDEVVCQVSWMNANTYLYVWNNQMQGSGTTLAMNGVYNTLQKPEG